MKNLFVFLFLLASVPAFAQWMGSIQYRDWGHQLSLPDQDVVVSKDTVRIGAYVTMINPSVSKTWQEECIVYTYCNAQYTVTHTLCQQSESITASNGSDRECYDSKLSTTQATFFSIIINK